MAAAWQDLVATQAWQWVQAGLTLTLGAWPLAVGAAPGVGTGPLDLRLGGFAASYGAVGALKNKLDERTGAYGLRRDYELQLDLRGRHAATGLTYGAILKLKPDDPAGVRDAEGYAFIRGAVGELRLGDDEGVSQNMALGGFTIATGSGGTDGEILDSPATTFIVDGNATKLVAYSPEIAGLRLGLSFTPHGESRGRDIGRTDGGGLDDAVEAGMSWAGDVGPVELKVSVIGLRGHANEPDEGRSRRVRGLYGGAVASLGDVDLGAGFGRAVEADRRRDWLNVGAALDLEPVTLSANLGWVVAGDAPAGLRVSRPINLVLGAELALAPGLVLSLETSFFDDSRPEREVTPADDEGEPATTVDRFDHGDAGVLAVSRLAIEF